MRLRLGLALAVAVASSLAPCRAAAATLDWKGHTWQVTSGGMAGVCEGNPANVTIDANGYLHFRISNAGGTWTASEIFTTDRLGFGTYQWHVDGPIDTTGGDSLPNPAAELLLTGGPSGPRGERKPLEESPDTTGQGGG